MTTTTSPASGHQPTVWVARDHTTQALIAEPATTRADIDSWLDYHRDDDRIDAYACPAWTHLADIPTTIRTVADRDGQTWQRHPEHDDRWAAIDDDGSSSLGYHGPDLAHTDEWGPFSPVAAPEPVNGDAQVLRDYAALCRISGQLAATNALPNADAYEHMATVAEGTATHLDQHGLTMAELLASGQADGQ